MTDSTMLQASIHCGLRLVLVISESFKRRHPETCHAHTQLVIHVHILDSVGFYMHVGRVVYMLYVSGGWGQGLDFATSNVLWNL